MKTLASIRLEQAIQKTLAVHRGISETSGMLDENKKVTPKVQTEVPRPSV